MNREIKNIIYEQLAIITKALSNPKRLEIIELLSQGEKSVETITAQADLGVKNASAQLKELKSAGLLSARRDGKFVYYRLANDSIISLWQHLNKFAQGNSAALQKIMFESLSAPDALEQVSRKDLIQRAKRNEITLIDVRPADEFETAHLPFAQSVPAGELAKHLRLFPKNKEIIAYCRGPYCFLAKDVVEALLRKGFKASRLQDSVHDWKSYGLPLEGKNLDL